MSGWFCSVQIPLGNCTWYVCCPAYTRTCILLPHVGMYAQETLPPQIAESCCVCRSECRECGLNLSSLQHTYAPRRFLDCSRPGLSWLLGLLLGLVPVYYCYWLQLTLTVSSLCVSSLCVPTEICHRLLWQSRPGRALFTNDSPANVLSLVKHCRHGRTTAEVEIYVQKLREALEIEADGVSIQDIAPPPFEGQTRFGKKLDYLSEEIQAAKTGVGSVPKGFKQPLPWEF